MKTVLYVYGWFTAFLIVMTVGDCVANGWMSQQQSDNWDASVTLVFWMWFWLTIGTLLAACLADDW